MDERRELCFFMNVVQIRNVVDFISKASVASFIDFLPVQGRTYRILSKFQLKLSLGVGCGIAAKVETVMGCTKKETSE